MEMCRVFFNWSCFFSVLKRKKGLKAARASVPQLSLSEKATSWPFGVFPFFNSDIWEAEGGS